MDKVTITLNYDAAPQPGSPSITIHVEMENTSADKIKQIIRGLQSLSANSDKV